MKVVAEVWKDGERAAEALNMRSCVLEEPFSGIERLDLYFFVKMMLTPSTLTYILNGRALGHYFDHCGLRIFPVPVPGSQGEPLLIDGLRYVHGNVPRPLVKNLIFSVLLALPTYKGGVPIDNATFLSYLPEIYRRFLASEENR
jgi:hypothetical protein